VEFKLPQDEARKEEHEALGFDVLPYDKRWGNYRLRLTAEDFDDRADAFAKLCADAETHYRTGAPVTDEMSRRTQWRRTGRAGRACQPLALAPTCTPPPAPRSSSNGSTIVGSCCCSARAVATRLPWQALEEIPEFFRRRGWLRTTGTFDTESEEGTLSAHLKRYVKRETANWVAVVLEEAGVLELDRNRPVRARLRDDFDHGR
jgi:hypothetical protein